MAVALRIPTPCIDHIKNDEPVCKYRAWDVFNKWRHQEGKDATLKNLEDSLGMINEQNIAQKLYGKSLNT